MSLSLSLALFGYVPAHAALPGARAAGGGGRGLVGPAEVRALQVSDHLEVGGVGAHSLLIQTHTNTHSLVLLGKLL